MEIIREFIATEKSRIIKSDKKNCNEYMRTIKSTHYQMELLDFLNKSIPGLDKISAAARTKVSQCFRERVFMPRMKLIAEGKVSD